MEVKNICFIIFTSTDTVCWGLGHTSISLTGMMAQEQIPNTEENGMTQNSNPKNGTTD